MATVTWNSGVAGDWNAAGNWTPSQVPQAGTTAVITAGTAELLSGVDPAAGITLDLGGPTVPSPGTTGGPLPGAFLDTLNNTFGPNFTLNDTTPGYEGVLATTGITDFSGTISVAGTNTLLIIGVDRQNAVGVKAGLVAGAVANTVANPADTGSFENNGTIAVAAGAGVLVTPTNNADDGLVSMLIGTIDLNAGSFVSTYVTLGPPAGGIGTSGVLNLANGSEAVIQLSSNIAINFQDGSNNKVYFTSTGQAAVISGLRAGDEIVQTPQSLLGQSTPYQNQGLQYNTATHVLQVTTGVGGTPYLDYNLAGTYAPGAFRASDDASGNLVITVACFAAGTGIATDAGMVAVEHLAPGMQVRLESGGTAPVVWIGHRHIDCRRHPDPEAVWPVRIAAHAFGMGRPARPLLLSRDHAVFIDGFLIPVRYLLNGATVAQVKRDRIGYFHVELAQHAVLLAEGLPAESYLDTGNRAAFANGGTTVMAHADFARGVWARASCAPLVLNGPVRDRVFRRLIAQAVALQQAARWRPAAPGALRTA
jgi:hypothetical protein